MEEINKIVDAVVNYENNNNFSWTKVYEEVLKDLKIENKIKDSNLLLNVVKEITKRGYDIVGEPFKLEKYK